MRRPRGRRIVPHTRDVCLATAVNDSFVPGAVVMLGSFRAHHPGFEGDVVVLHDGLSEASRTVLSTAGGRVRFEPVRPALLERVASLEAAYPGRLHSLAAFHTLEAFRLGGYRKVLFYDSDVLFQGPVGELFDTDAALLCCGDLDLAMGKVRDAETLQPIARTAAGAGRGRPVLERPFNSGFLLIGASCAGERVYSDLLALMAPEAWRGAVIRLSDQDVLNRYFAGRQTLASWTYNYFVSQAPVLRARTGLDAARAKVLHFKGPVKPWTTDAMLCWAHGDDVHARAPAGGRLVPALVRRLCGRPGASAFARGAAGAGEGVRGPRGTGEAVRAARRIRACRPVTSPARRFASSETAS